MGTRVIYIHRQSRRMRDVENCSMGPNREPNDSLWDSHDAKNGTKPLKHMGFDRDPAWTYGFYCLYHGFQNCLLRWKNFSEPDKKQLLNTFETHMRNQAFESTSTNGLPV